MRKREKRETRESEVDSVGRGLSQDPPLLPAQLELKPPLREPSISAEGEEVHRWSDSSLVPFLSSTAKRASPWVNSSWQHLGAHLEGK